jgi:hypothetical protein
MDFAEGTGTKTYSRGSYAAVGNLTGGTVWNASGRYGYALSFNESNQRIYIDNLTAPENHTVLVWAKCDNIALYDYASIIVQDYYRGFWLYSDDDGIYLDYYFDRNYFSDETISLGEWHLIGFTQTKLPDGNISLTYYADGQPIGYYEKAFGPINYTEIGNDPRDEVFLGSLDELVIYGRALSSQEILDLYNEQNFNGTHKIKVWANDTINQFNSSSLLTFSIGPTGGAQAPETGCISGQSTPTILCSNSCVTMNLAFKIDDDKNNTIHTDNSDCNALTNGNSASGFSSLENKFISAERDNKVLGIVFAGSSFYHTYFNTSYSSAAYLLQMKQAARGNKFLITFTNGTYATLDSAVGQARNKIPGRTFGDIAKETRASFPLYIRAEYDTIDIASRIRWDGAVRIAIRNSGLVNGLANITLSLLSGG